MLIFIKSNEDTSGSYTEKYQDHIPCSSAHKHNCADQKFSEPVVLYKGENTDYNFTKRMLKEFGYCKKVMENIKNLIMNEKEEENFRSSNRCWICEKLIDDEKQEIIVK